MFDYIAISGTMENRVTEFVDHLHEHFVDPVVIRRARYQPPVKAGYGTEIKKESRLEYRFPDGPAWTESTARTGIGTEGS
jgi:L-fuconate dehydratase